MQSMPLSKEIETTFGAVQQDILNAQAQQGAQGQQAGAANNSTPDDHVTDVDIRGSEVRH